jgi:hypothetical protein
LKKVELSARTNPIEMTVSWGASAFNSVLHVETAIEAADNDMYARKEGRKVEVTLKQA